MMMRLALLLLFWPQINCLPVTQLFLVSKQVFMAREMGWQWVPSLLPATPILMAVREDRCIFSRSRIDDLMFIWG